MSSNVVVFVFCVRIVMTVNLAGPSPLLYSLKGPPWEWTNHAWQCYCRRSAMSKVASTYDWRLVDDLGMSHEVHRSNPRLVRDRDMERRTKSKEKCWCDGRPDAWPVKIVKDGATLNFRFFELQDGRKASARHVEYSRCVERWEQCVLDRKGNTNEFMSVTEIHIGLRFEFWVNREFERIKHARKVGSVYESSQSSGKRLREDACKSLGKRHKLLPRD